MYPQGVCRIRKPAYAGNGCAIFLVFQTEEVGQKDGCGSQTQLCGVAVNNPQGKGRGKLHPALFCYRAAISATIFS